MRKTLILKAWSCKRPKGVEQFQQSDHFRGVKLRTACKHDQTKRHYSKRLALEAKNSPKTVDMPVFTKYPLISQLPRCSLSDSDGWI